MTVISYNCCDASYNCYNANYNCPTDLKTHTHIHTHIYIYIVLKLCISVECQNTNVLIFSGLDIALWQVNAKASYNYILLMINISLYTYQNPL